MSRPSKKEVINAIPEEQLNKVLLGDCLKLMDDLPDNSIDAIIADPPYNLSSGSTIDFLGGKVVKGMGGVWKKTMENWDNIPLTEYFSFTFAWLEKAKRVLKPSGSMWIFGTYHNLGVVNFVCQLLGLEIINEVVWYKKNAFPNLAGRRLTASHETILWIHKCPKKRQYKFNYEYSKDGDFSYDDLKSPGKQMRTVWSISNNKEKWELEWGKHPTQKPARLIERIIRLCSDEGDVILSPFAGSGTDCLVSKMTNRNFIGFELEEEYVELSKTRLNNAPVRIC